LLQFRKEEEKKAFSLCLYRRIGNIFFVRFDVSFEEVRLVAKEDVFANSSSAYHHFLIFFLPPGSLPVRLLTTI
jgi:hypothetical protein